MDSNKITPEAFQTAGYEMGYMLAAAFHGMVRGFADYQPPAPEEEQTTQERVKTRLSDCRACWCNTCTKIEDCDTIRAELEPDGERPNPCVGCYNGMRLMPREIEPDCGEYEQREYENNG